MDLEVLEVPEVEEGNIEYKRHILHPSNEKLERLTSQMRWRLNEGNGEAIYIVGIEDDGHLTGISDAEMQRSKEMLEFIASKLDCKLSVINERKGKYGKICDMLIREYKDNKYIDIRIAVCGEEDSGKSTLVAVLSRGKLDDGNGLMRVHCFNHLHEIECGTTSSISHQILGFTSNGECINSSEFDSIDVMFHKTPADIVNESHKVISFLDLPGMQNYMKTAIGGLIGHIPDYGLLIIDSTRGLTKHVQEQWQIMTELKLPIIIGISKIDLVNRIKINEIIKHLRKVWCAPGKKVQVITDKFISIKESMIPIFLLSSVTGEGIDVFKSFLNILPVHSNLALLCDNCQQVSIKKKYFIDGIGTIVGGIVTSGTIHVSDEMQIGPDDNGNFQKVFINSIFKNYRSVSEARAGNSATFCLKNVAFNKVRRGMVLLDSREKPTAYRKFTANVTMWHKVLNLNKPVIHCRTIRQPAEIIKKEAESHEITFNFMYKSEYIKPGMRIIFNGACGVILTVFN